MARTKDIQADMLQDLVLQDTLYPEGTTDAAIDSGTATPDDISAKTYEVVIHARAGDNTPLKTYVMAGGAVFFPNGGTDGQVWTAIPVADLTSLGVGDFVYYVHRVDAGQMKIVTKGEFSLVGV